MHPNAAPRFELPALVIMNHGLRLADQPALAEGCRHRACLLVWFPGRSQAAEASHALGAARRVWTYHSVAQLNTRLRPFSQRVWVLADEDPTSTLRRLVGELHWGGVYWLRDLTPWGRRVDARWFELLGELNIAARSFPSVVLREPSQVLKKDGTPYLVYTPFSRAVTESILATPSDSSPAVAPALPPAPNVSLRDAADTLLPPAREGVWPQQVMAGWEPGEEAGKARLREFICRSEGTYGRDRNRPDLDATSRLSPYLASGDLAPRTVLRHLRVHLSPPQLASSVFFKELLWREFSAHQLYHFPHALSEPLKPEFAKLKLQAPPDALQRWQQGMTGYPIVDAGMRQLWQTGWMHNRVRMIVASFLIKDLGVPWQEGERWFWDTLLDADPASNALSWQWVAGCGRDAQPFFRIFNPTLQGEKFDPAGSYVRHWVPQLGQLRGGAIHQPWILPPNPGTLRPYPLPIVDHQVARRAALEAYERTQNR